MAEDNVEELTIALLERIDQNAAEMQRLLEETREAVDRAQRARRGD